MSGISTFTRTPARHFGPVAPTRLELMGIRFANDPGDGTGAGDGQGGEGDPKPGENKPDFTPISDQAELDRILTTRLAREREKFSDYDQLKKDSEELTKLREQSATDQERAVNAARDEGRDEVRKELHQERAKNALSTALSGRQLKDPFALADLDRTRFIKDGQVDGEAVTAWVEENSTITQNPNEKDPAQGRRGAGEGTVDAGRSAYQQRHGNKK